MRRVIFLLWGLCCSLVVAVACTSPEGNDSESKIGLLDSSIIADADGGGYSVVVASQLAWSASCESNWVVMNKNEGGAGATDFQFSVTANPELTERNAMIVFQCLNDTSSAILNISQGVSEITVVTKKTQGWAEMPKVVADDNLEYCTHDKLPSNNKLRNYSFCFDKEKHCALWVAYPLHSCYTDGSGNRTNAWGYDPCCVEDKYEPYLKNAYYPQGGSSYSHSRGHQLPSADRLASNEDNATTFYYTNMTPQLQSLNGASWGALEGDLRSKWMCSDTLYVVTGAHFAEGYGYAYDNKGAGKACAVPTHYYKVILRTKKGNSGKWVGNCSADELKCVGFWFEHKGGAARQTMSVAEIEKKTGHTFFPNVPNAPKSTYNASEW